MTAQEFKQKVKVGTKIKNNGQVYECIEVFEEFMYSFKEVNSDSNRTDFAIIGITDGSVANIELA